MKDLSINGTLNGCCIENNASLAVIYLSKLLAAVGHSFSVAARSRLFLMMAD